MREQGFDCTAVIADVTQPDDADSVIQATRDAYGAIDILVNNAGQTWGQPTEELPLEKWRQVVETNLTGAFIMSQRIGRYMLGRGQGGRIINIASIAGIVAGERRHADDRLQREQGRTHLVHALAGDGVGAARHPGERDRAGMVPDAHGAKTIESIRSAHRPQRAGAHR